jgi:hypothetical protein
LGEHAVNGAFYSFDPDCDPDPDYQRTTDIDSILGCDLSVMDNRNVLSGIPRIHGDVAAPGRLSSSKGLRQQERIAFIT